MYYPNLRLALDQYCQYLVSTFKQSVQVDTGALRDSVKVSCVVNDQEYDMTISLKKYWRWIPQPFPWDDAFKAAGILHPHEYTTYSQESGYTRYQFNPAMWKQRLNAAFQKDIEYMLNNVVK